MPHLSFAVENARPIRPAVGPTLGFSVGITQTTSAPVTVHSLLLHSQIRIEPVRRRHDAAEPGGQAGLFDQPERGDKAARSLLWTHVTTLASGFTAETTVELPVPCSFDFSLAATRYFDSLPPGGEIPLNFLFSGTLFYEAADGSLKVAQVPWGPEARFQLSTATWKQLMDAYYPDAAWLRLRKDVFDSLQRFKAGRGLPSLERALEELLEAAESEVH